MSRTRQGLVTVTADAWLERLLVRMEGEAARREDESDGLPAHWTAGQRAAWHQRGREIDARWAEEERTCQVWLQRLREVLGGDELLVAFLRQRVRAYDPANPHTRWAIEGAKRRAHDEGRAITDEEAAHENWLENVDCFVRNQVVAQQTPEAVIADDRRRF